jgi:hypothetical protein
MDAHKFDSALKRLRMNISGAARFFDIDRRTIRRYARGELKVPVALALLVTALLKHHRKEPNDLRRAAGLDPVMLDLPVGRPINDE